MRHQTRWRCSSPSHESEFGRRRADACPRSTARDPATSPYPPHARRSLSRRSPIPPTTLSYACSACLFSVNRCKHPDPDTYVPGVRYAEIQAASVNQCDATKKVGSLIICHSLSRRFTSTASGSMSCVASPTCVALDAEDVLRNYCDAKVSIWPFFDI